MICEFWNETVLKTAIKALYINSLLVDAKLSLTNIAAQRFILK